MAWTQDSRDSWVPPWVPPWEMGLQGSPRVPLLRLLLLRDGDADPTNDPDPANDTSRLAAAPGPNYF